MNHKDRSDFKSALNPPTTESLNRWEDEGGALAPAVIQPRVEKIERNHEKPGLPRPPRRSSSRESAGRLQHV